MDSFEINKIVAAVLMVALLVIGIGKLSNVIFHVEKPKTPGYAVEVEQATTVSSTTEKAVEQYVMAGIITSEFFGKFSDFKAIVNASVPLAHPIAYLAPT